MTLGPIAFGRIPDRLAFDRLFSTLAAQQRDLLRVQEQLATGIRLGLPSEEPMTALQAIGLQKLLERKTQVQTNLSSAQSYLAATDSALADVGERLRQAHSLALASIGDSSSAAERKAAVQQVDGIIDQLLATANQKFRGRYLFGGTRLTTHPYTRDGNLIRYNGDTGSTFTFSDLDSPLATNVSGSQVFGGISQAVEGTADLNPALTMSTRLNDLHAGRGVTRGQIKISDGSTTSMVDLTAAETIGDVVALIEDQGPFGISVNLNSANDGLEITLASGSLTVQEVGIGQTASDLGILAEVPVGLALSGGDLDPRLALTTRLADLYAGAGFDQASGLTITSGGSTQVIEFASDTTVEDLLNRLNGAGLGLRAEINEDKTGVNISTVLSGANFAIGENGGTTASDLGVRTLTLETLLSELNFGDGVPIAEGDDLAVTRKDGVVLNIDLDSAARITDVIDRINNHAGNADGKLVARLNAVGNGIELVDTTGGTANLSVSGRAAGSLGIQASASDPATTLAGTDVNLREANGVFTSLLRLRDALEADNESEIERAAAALSTDIENVALVQGDAGARLQVTENRLLQSAQEEVQLRDLLSQQLDTDLAEAISELQLRQSAFQAALASSSLTLKTNLLDFL